MNRGAAPMSAPAARRGRREDAARAGSRRHSPSQHHRHAPTTGRRARAAAANQELREDAVHVEQELQLLESRVKRQRAELLAMRQKQRELSARLAMEREREITEALLQSATARSLSRIARFGAVSMYNKSARWKRLAAQHVGAMREMAIPTI